MSTRKTRRRTKRKPAERVIDTLPVKSPGEVMNKTYAFYGRAGTGKTTLACTFPTPILLLDVRDRGTESVANVEDVDVMDVNEWDDFETAYWYLKKKPKKYKTLVIDTMSQLQQLVVEEIAMSKNKDKDRAGDWGTLHKRDWGDVAAKLKIWTTRLRDLPMEVIFIAQDRVFNFNEDDDDEDDDMLSPEVGPRLSPAIAAHLCAECSVICNTFIRRTEKVRRVKGKKKTVKKTEYCMRVGPNPIYITKIRKPREIITPSIVVDPSYEAIMEIIKGE